ncbi:butyrophilin subfamily 2 member A1-like [Coregonus clupeaformis]|uniref:butyrophilin subfamily 2 member A1-like n=1 Tax=Coregonus clupeaformis TaxID=59861 RepID=UPI001E1C8387|nr:butyrophilin subfamily 2 member A1-like [Coregonus clupeaformis]XP_045072942.1 butyrophilin subfamily 2 member A1-like [Coregonus clupeaformis]
METGPDSLFVTLLLLLHSSHSESERFKVLGPTDPILAVAGDDIILPCYIKPNISAEEMTVDWLNLDFKDERVYRYQNHRIIQEDQIPSYRERTSLFKEDLWRGNASLKLTRVQGTDEGTYKCFIKALSWYDDLTIQVRVKAIGSKPVVSIEGHREGGMGLLCESEGWHPEPELVWLDSKGVHLSAGPPETHRDFKGFYTVKQHVIVQETDANHFTCRVQQRRINEKKETMVHVPNELFHHTSPWIMSFIVLCCLGAITVIGLALAIYWIYKKKGVIIDQLRLQRDDLRTENEKVKNDLDQKNRLCEQRDDVEKNLTSLLVRLTEERDDLKKENDDLRMEKDDLRKKRVDVTLDPDSASP